MIVEPLPATRGNLPGSVRTSARISFESWWMFPAVLWFEIPEAFFLAADPNGEAWVLASLPLACSLGEPLRCRIPLDSAFLQNIHRLMETWSRWHAVIRPVPLEVEAIKSAETSNNDRGTALFFTAGIDSFYSAFHYTQSPVRNGGPSFRSLEALVYVWGYDIPLVNWDSFQRKRQRLERVAEGTGAPLLVVASNLRETRLRKLRWGPLMHGPALGAVGLFLSRAFHTILISSSYGPQNLRVWRSHPETDPLMSTSRTRFVHYGADVDRFQKTAFVSNYPLALDNLHVCWQAATEQNCGRCEKCLRTLLALEIVGKCQEVSTFPVRAALFDALQNMLIPRELYERVYPGLRDHALHFNRPDLARAIDTCLARSRSAATSAPEPGRP